MLLSYPSIESYLVSCFVPDSHLLQFALGADLKEFIGANRRIQHNRLSEESLICAAETMLAYYESHSLGFTLDDQGDVNREILDKQEACYANSAEYRLLSLLSVAFLQLGILEIVESA